MPAGAKGHAEKVTVARRLRPETTMSLEWIAQRLYMVGITHVSHPLREKRAGLTPGRLSSCQ